MPRSPGGACDWRREIPADNSNLRHVSRVKSAPGGRGRVWRGAVFSRGSDGLRQTVCLETVLEPRRKAPRMGIAE